MRLRTRLFAGSVRWAAPVVLLLTLFYFHAGNTVQDPYAAEYAPAVVAAPLMTLYALAYASAAALAVWESGRLRAFGVWDMAPARSRYRVAGDALLPVILCAWLVVLVPTVLSLGSAGTLPTPDSLLLPGMAMLLCVAHAIIGFAIGLRAPHVVAAPVVAVLVWVAVAFTRAVDPAWVRHISGQYTDLMFGEAPSLLSLAPHLLFGGAIAAGLAMMWLPVRQLLVRAALALVVACAGTASAIAIADDWAHGTPLRHGQVAMECLGARPKVCMPAVTAQDLPHVRADVVSALRDLTRAKAVTPPEVVTDRLGEGRDNRSSTPANWSVHLTVAAREDAVKYAVTLAAVRLPCDEPDPARAYAVRLWAFSVTGEAEAFRSTAENKSLVSRSEPEVRAVLEKSTDQQAVWYQQQISDACGRAS
ncbi:hypothetical protein SSP531S_51150 [Streptomyces spongiicola]|nr:hypothetical protein [Streptomyces spongiicola]GBQ03640.1 hypothetical protein SSP531S_51150 [Streptomyces spongiicola]